MTEKAEKRGIKFIDTVAEKLTYSDNSKNGAFMIATISYVDNLHKSLQEVNRILKEGGL